MNFRLQWELASASASNDALLGGAGGATMEANNCWNSAVDGAKRQPASGGGNTIANSQPLRRPRQTRAGPLASCNEHIEIAGRPSSLSRMSVADCRPPTADYQPPASAIAPLASVAWRPTCRLNAPRNAAPIALQGEQDMTGFAHSSATLLAAAAAVVATCC